MDREIDTMKMMGLDFYLSPDNLKAGLLVSLLSVWVLVGVFYYLNRYTKRRYFSIWTVAWLFYALWLTLNLSLLSMEEKAGVVMLKHWCISVSATFLLWGSVSFLGRRVRQLLLGLFLSFLFVWSYVGAFHLTDHPLQIQLPIFGLIGLASIFTGYGFYQYRRKREFLASGLLAFGFCLWGIYLMAYSFLQNSNELSSPGFFMAAVLQLFIAVSMIILVLEQVRYANQRQAMREIKQQKREKNVLRHKVASTEERYRQLFYQASEPIIIAGAKDLRILEMNEAAEHLLGRARDEAGRQSLTAFCLTHSPVLPAPRTGEEWFSRICQERPLQMTRKDGSIVATEASGSAIDYEGEKAFQFFFRELTDRSEMEKQLRQAEKLSSLGQMISSVAHELQNPVTGIRTFLDLALTQADLSSQSRSDLNLAAQECTRLSRLVTNFLSLAREHSEQRQMVDLNETIRHLVELRKFDFSVAGVEHILELDPELPPTYANRDQLQQVLINLMNNALHAVSDRPSPGRIKFRTQLLEESIEFAVEDNGEGVPAQLQSRIFTPYFTTKPAGVGTGLGLSISHSIVCEHQGRIYYQESPLGGAAFVIEIPLVIESSERLPTGTRPALALAH